MKELIDMQVSDLPKKFAVFPKSAVESAAIQQYLFDNLNAAWGGDGKRISYTDREVLYLDERPNGWRISYSKKSDYDSDFIKEYPDVLHLKTKVEILGLQMEREVIYIQGKKYDMAKVQEALRDQGVDEV